MDILAVSPVSEYAGEALLLPRLFEGGLARYHLRKPSWSLARCAEWLRAIPASLLSQISIHQHHELADTFGVGLHLKDGPAAALPVAERRLAEAPLRSRSLHGLHRLETSLDGFGYALLSPVFPSISKSGYGPQWSEAELRQALAAPRRAKLYALGGITAANAARAVDFGFDGVVLHGALWQAVDPLAELLKLTR